MPESTALLNVVVNAAGADTAIQQVSKNLAGLGVTGAAAGDKAAEGLDKIGKKAQAEVDKIKRAQQALERATVAERFGANSPESFVLRARHKGIPDEAISAQTAALAAARKATADSAAAELAQIEAKRQAKAAAAQAELAQLAAVRRAKEREAELDKLTTSLGASNFVKPLTKIPGVDLSQATTSLGASALGGGLALIPNEAQQAEAALNKAGAAAQKSGIQFNQYGLSAKQTAAALRQVPAQLTDIFVSLQGGQAPLTVLLQQGGQLKDVFGGIRPAAQALGRAVLGLINPLTIAASVTVALALAFKQGREENDQFAKALILSGNAAGTTVGSLQDMAKAISGVVGTQGAASEALAQFAADGNTSASSLQRFATVALKLQREAGIAVSETVKNFSALGKDPLQASIKLNETTRFLTQSLYQQIRALDEVGRTADAAAVAQRGFADAMEGRADQLIDRLGYIERAWNGIKGAAKGAWDAMLNVGRPDSNGDQISKLQAQLSALEGPSGVGAEFGGNSASPALEAEKQSLRDRIDLLQTTERELKRVAGSQAEANDKLKARIKFDADGLRYLSEEKRIRLEIEKAKNEGRAAGASEKEIQDRIAAINASRKKGGSSAPRELDIGNKRLADEVAETQRQLDALTGSYRNAESILEAVRSAGLVDEAEYYANKRKFIELGAKAQDEAAQATIDANRREIDRLEALKLATAKKRPDDKNAQIRIDGEILDLNRKIADSEAKRAIATAAAGAQITVSLTQQEAAARALESALLGARQAAQASFDKSERGRARDIAGIGQGSQARQFNAGISQIEDQFDDRRRDEENLKRRLELEGKFTAEARKNYEEQLRILEEFKGKELAAYTANYQKILAAQKDFANGAKDALADYIADVANVAKSTESLFTKAFNGLEDALVEFTTTGKLNFKNLAGSIVADINRIIIRQNITGPLAEMIQGGFKSGDGPGGFLKDILGPLLGAQSASTAAETAAQASATAAITAAQASSSAAIVAGITSTSAAATAANTAAIGASTSAIVAAITASSATSSAGGLGSLGSLFGGNGASSYSGLGGGAENYNWGGGFASGGRPPLGKVSLVGENGPELFIPDSAGRILSNRDTQAALKNEQRAVVVHIHQTYAPGTSKKTLEQGAAEAARAARQALARGTA